VTSSVVEPVVLYSTDHVAGCLSIQSTSATYSSTTPDQFSYSKINSQLPVNTYSFTSSGDTIVPDSVVFSSVAITSWLVIDHDAGVYETYGSSPPDALDILGYRRNSMKNTPIKNTHFSQWKCK
jgi:hypothetical protein